MARALSVVNIHFDAGGGGIALVLPCCDLADEVRCVINAAIEALAVENADLDLDHVEPTGVLGRVVELEAAQDAAGLGRRECFVEGAGRVGR